MQNIKSIHKIGFTVIELLIVIAVIAILASITIISYSGITSNSNTAKSSMNALSVQKVIESFNSDCSRFPGTLVEFTSSKASCFTSSSVPSNLNVTGTSTPLNASNGLTNLTYEYSGVSGAATGGRIKYWDFTINNISNKVIYLGSATAGSTFTSI